MILLLPAIMPWKFRFFAGDCCAVEATAEPDPPRVLRELQCDATTLEHRHETITIFIHIDPSCLV